MGKAYIYKKYMVATGKYYVGKHNGKNKWYKGGGTLWLEDYKKYVKNSKIDIITEILEYVDDINQINEREIFWLSYYDVVNNPKFYNMTDKSYGPYVLTEESKLKIGKSNSKPKPEGFGELHYKKIIQYDLEGNFIRNWDSATQAKKELKLHNIANNCRGQYKSCGNYVFRYHDNPLPEGWKMKTHGNRNRIRPESDLEKMRIPHPSTYKPVIQYDKNWNFIKEYDSIKQAALSNNLNPGGISGCCRDNNRCLGGYKFKYKIND